jgi:ParB-like nuclease domain
VTRLTVSVISGASPEMPDKLFEDLVDDIRRNGQLLPIVKRGGEIIDGRKRFRACEILGLTPLAIDMRPDQDPETLSYSLNVLRTHYTDGQRALFAERRATATRADGPLRKNGKFAGLRESNGTADLARVVTVEEAAAEVAVSPSTVRAARRLRQRATVEVVEAVAAGRLSLHAGSAIARAPKSEQAETLARAIDATRGSRTGERRTLKKLPTLPVADRIERTLSSLKVSSELIGSLVLERGAAGHPDFEDWIARVERARTALSRAINRVRGRRA